MSFKFISTGVIVFFLFVAVQSQAASCLNGGCHQGLVAKRYLHGPVAAEQMGAKGCVACHVPAGPPCDKNGGGTFKPMPPAARMCRLCHASGTGTQHSAKKIDCLKCHDPHGSATSPTFNR